MVRSLSSFTRILIPVGQPLPVDVMTQRPHVIMCPATEFDIEITPDSNPIETGAGANFIARRRWAKGDAITQNNSLAALYKHLGVTVLDMKPEPELRDQIFTTDTSHLIIRAQRNADGEIVVAASHLVYARMSKEIREQEVDAKKTFFEGHLRESDLANLSIHQMQSNIEMGDTRLCPAKGVIFAGVGAKVDSSGKSVIRRTSPEAHAELSEVTGIPVVTLNLKGDYYHLDTAFCPLPDGHAMIFPKAFEPESLAKIEQILGAEKLIYLAEADVKAFAANSFVVHHQIIAPKGISISLQQQLNSIGYDVYLHEIEAPKMSGGGHNCMTDSLSQVVVEGGYVPKSLERHLAAGEGKVFEVIATPGHGFGGDITLFEQGREFGARIGRDSARR